ncbi:hypothetical protein [Bergeyella sp. RCAD1439]|uniref:hypothetical protein n=1 Tax=Bergeyella anatis TaxID=3113737 RepID=UPI002E1848C0|nr:hypothetical protein [Bergeyella sp. RCAD1439]
MRKEFHSEIRKSKAEKFTDQYDAFSPQTAYFVDGKLKFLELETHSELSTCTELITFENNSIAEIKRHELIYKGNKNGNEAGRDWNHIEKDRIFILNIPKRRKEIYTYGRHVGAGKILTADTVFINKIKTQTEQKYNAKVKKPLPE